jgi:hypothetical protein
MMVYKFYCFHGVHTNLQFVDTFFYFSQVERAKSNLFDGNCVPRLLKLERMLRRSKAVICILTSSV